MAGPPAWDLAKGLVEGQWAGGGPPEVPAILIPECHLVAALVHCSGFPKLLLVLYAQFREAGLPGLLWRSGWRVSSPQTLLCFILTFGNIAIGTIPGSPPGDPDDLQCQFLQDLSVLE